MTNDIRSYLMRLIIEIENDDDLAKALMAVISVIPTQWREGDRTKTPFTVIHEGKSLEVIYPHTDTTPAPRPSFGAMKGSGKILGDVISPVAPTWEVIE